jgi:hypothetical protein
MASVKVRLDPKTVIYGRVADTMLSGLEAIGGFNESLMHIGILFVFFFQERLFKSSFMRQVYMLQSENKQLEDKRIDENQMLKDATLNQQVDESYLKKLLDYIILRLRFTYGYKEMFHYLSRCLCFRHVNPRLSVLHKKHVLFKKGSSKLERELDVVNLVRSIRQLRLMAQVLLGPSERLLLKFQRKNVVETTSSSSDSDHHKYDTMKLLNSKKDLVKLQ